MKKKITLISLAVVALLLVGLLGSLAFLTDEKDVTNTFTVGNVKIDLEEPTYPVDDEPLKLLPGTEIDKDPTVTLKEGSEDAYIFMQIIYVDGIETVLEAIEISDKWVLIDADANLYVYSDTSGPIAVSAATADNVLEPLFEEIVVDATLDNSVFEALGAEPQLIIRAFAHQALVNGTDAYTTALAAAEVWAGVTP